MPDVTTDIAELERLLAEATPGPWSSQHGYDEPELSIWAGGHCLFADSFRYARSADAALIAAAVNALPALLAERERLRGAILRINRAPVYEERGEPASGISLAMVRAIREAAVLVLTEAGSWGGCPNGPDRETGEWPCDPKGYFGVAECQTCGRIGTLEGASGD